MMLKGQKSDTEVFWNSVLEEGIGLYLPSCLSIYYLYAQQYYRSLYLQSAEKGITVFGTVGKLE